VEESRDRSFDRRSTGIRRHDELVPLQATFALPTVFRSRDHRRDGLRHAGQRPDHAGLLVV